MQTEHIARSFDSFMGLYRCARFYFEQFMNQNLLLLFGSDTLLTCHAFDRRFPDRIRMWNIESCIVIFYIKQVINFK